MVCRDILLSQSDMQNGDTLYATVLAKLPELSTAVTPKGSTKILNLDGKILTAVD